MASQELQDRIVSMAKIFIYGGCVTRDTFELMKNEHTLVEYVARQSLVSAASSPTVLESKGALSSAFQSRTVEADLRSSLFQSMRRHADNTDLMIIDLLSDRLGVIRMNDGAYITRSVELERSGRLGDQRGSFIEFGTDRHFNLWKASFAKFTRIAKKTGLWPKLLILQADWASVMEDGSSTPKFRRWDAIRGNELYERYYEHVKASGARMIEIPTENLVGSPTHKWGPAPYHYTDAAYRSLQKEFEVVIAEA